MLDGPEPDLASMSGSVLIENTDALREKGMLRQYTHFVVAFNRTRTS